MSDSEKTEIPKPGMSAKIMWYMCTSDDPVTSIEIQEEFDMNRQTVSTQLLRLYKQGFLKRRIRDNGNPGPNPYEYRLMAQSERKSHPYTGRDNE